MAFLTDPISLMTFAAAGLLAFFAGRLGLKAVLWWRKRQAPPPSGPEEYLALLKSNILTVLIGLAPKATICSVLPCLSGYPAYYR